MNTIISLLEPLHRWCFAHMRRTGMLLACQDAPDTTGMQQAALKSAEIGKDALDFWKFQYSDQAPLRQRAADRADQVSLAQLEAMKTNTDLARQYQEERAPYRAAEQIQLKKALDYNTEAKREELAGKAAADVASSFDGAQGQLTRDMGRYNVRASGDAIALGLKDLQTKQTLATVGAKNRARREADVTGRAMLADAINTGRNLPNNQATSAQIALSAGNSAANTGAMPVNIAQQGAQLMQQGFSQGMQGYGQSGNLYGQIAQIDQRANDNSGLWQGLGSVAGGFLGGSGFANMISSDKRIKRDRKAVSGEVALSQARRMPVDSWKYKKGSPADDGGKTHVGPMAQDVRAAAGDKVAPGGKAIDLVSMNGITLAAVQQLDKNVRRLEKRVVSLADARRA